MKKLTFIRQIKGVTACSFLGYGYLAKEEKRIVLKDRDNSDVVSLPNSLYGRRFILSPAGKDFLFLPSLFPHSLTLYSLPTLREEAVFEKEGCVFKDAAFSSGGETLYLLADKEREDKVETILLVYDRRKKTCTCYFEGEGRRFDSLVFSPYHFCLTLLERKGKISFFQDGSLIKERKVPSFRKIFLRDKGTNRICDCDYGFRILSQSGKVLRNCDFLLPRREKKATPAQRKKRQQYRERQTLRGKGNPLDLKKGRNEIYADRLVPFKENQVFYVTVSFPEREYSLYFFSLNSFRRKKKLSLKGDYFSMSYSQGRLFVFTSLGCFLFQLDDE